MNGCLSLSLTAFDFCKAYLRPSAPPICGLASTCRNLFYVMLRRMFLAASSTLYKYTCIYVCLLSISLFLSLSSILSPLLSVLFYSSLSFPLLSFLVSLFLFSSLSPLFDLVFSLSSPLLPCPSLSSTFCQRRIPLSNVVCVKHHNTLQ